VIAVHKFIKLHKQPGERDIPRSTIQIWDANVRFAWHCPFQTFEHLNKYKSGKFDEAVRIFRTRAPPRSIERGDPSQRNDTCVVLRDL
jgi:hypothetical protein